MLVCETVERGPYLRGPAVRRGGTLRQWGEGRVARGGSDGGERGGAARWLVPGPPPFLLPRGAAPKILTGHSSGEYSLCVAYSSMCVVIVFYRFSLGPMVLYFVFVDFQVFSRAQRRTRAPIGNHWETVESH